MLFSRKQLSKRSVRPYARLLQYLVDRRKANSSTSVEKKIQPTRAANMQSRYKEAASILVLEAGVKEWKQTRRSLSGQAVWKTKSITTPPPTTLRRFLVVAHECKHIEVGPQSSLKSYEREFECVKAEEEACKRFEFSFPRKALERNKRYVAYRLKQGLRRGLAPCKVNNAILRWCFDYLPEREKRLFGDVLQ